MQVFAAGTGQEFVIVKRKALAPPFQAPQPLPGQAVFHPQPGIVCKRAAAFAAAVRHGRIRPAVLLSKTVFDSRFGKGNTRPERNVKPESPLRIERKPPGRHQVMHIHILIYLGFHMLAAAAPRV